MTNSIRSRSQSSTSISHAYLNRAKLFPSILNLAHTIVGVGIVGLPFAVSKMGLLLGLTLFIISGVLSGFTLFLMAEVARAYPGETMMGLSMRTIPNLRFVADIAIITMCFGGGCTSFLICIGDIMPRVAKRFFSSNAHGYILYNRQFWIISFVILISPLVFQRTLNALRYVSALSFCCLIYVSSMVFVRASELDTLPEYSWGPGTAVDVLKAMPMFIFGFTCHQNMPQISNELINNSRRRLLCVIIGAFSIVSMIYGVVGFIGYVVFGNLVSSDYLKSFPEEDVYEYGNLLFAIATAFIYPLWSFPLRQSFGNIVLGYSNWTCFQHCALTSFVILVSTSIALAVSNLGTVISLVGGTSCTTISYIIPGAFYYFHVRRADAGYYKSLSDTNCVLNNEYVVPSKCDNFLRYAALAMIVLGCMIVVMVISIEFL